MTNASWFRRHRPRPSARDRGPSLRPARGEDAPDIAAVHAASWKAAYGELMPRAVLEHLGPAERTRRWRAELERRRGEGILAELDGQVVGFSYLSASRDADARPSTGEVQALYVAPAVWRRSVGSSLLTASLARLRALGLEEVSVWVLDRNAPARRFYRARGFEADGGRKTHRTGLVEIRLVRSTAEAE